MYLSQGRRVDCGKELLEFPVFVKRYQRVFRKSVTPSALGSQGDGHQYCHGKRELCQVRGGCKYSVIPEYLPDGHKTYNPSKHVEFTLKSNELLQKNARKIAASRQTELIIRVPVITGFKGTKEELLEIGRFADFLPGVRQIHLLPYHSFGRGKYEGLGRDYPMGEVETPSKEKCSNLKKR